MLAPTSELLESGNLAPLLGELAALLSEGFPYIYWTSNSRPYKLFPSKKGP